MKLNVDCIYNNNVLDKKNAQDIIKAITRKYFDGIIESNLFNNINTLPGFLFTKDIQNSINISNLLMIYQDVYNKTENFIIELNNKSKEFFKLNIMVLYTFALSNIDLKFSYELITQIETRQEFLLTMIQVLRLRHFDLKRLKTIDNHLYNEAIFLIGLGVIS